MKKPLTVKLDRMQIKENISRLNSANIPQDEINFIINGKVPSSLNGFWNNRKSGIAKALRDILTIGLPTYETEFKRNKKIGDLRSLADKSFQDQVESLIIKGMGRGLTTQKNKESILKQVRSCWGRIPGYSNNIKKIKNKGARSKDFMKQMKVANAAKNPKEVRDAMKIARHLKAIGKLVEGSLLAEKINQIINAINELRPSERSSGYVVGIIEDLVNLGERSESSLKSKKQMKDMLKRLKLGD